MNIMFFFFSFSVDFGSIQFPTKFSCTSKIYTRSKPSRQFWLGLVNYFSLDQSLLSPTRRFHIKVAWWKIMDKVSWNSCFFFFVIWGLIINKYIQCRMTPPTFSSWLLIGIMVILGESWNKKIWLFKSKCGLRQGWHLAPTLSERKLFYVFVEAKFEIALISDH